MGNIMKKLLLGTAAMIAFAAPAFAADLPARPYTKAPPYTPPPPPGTISLPYNQLISGALTTVDNPQAAAPKENDGSAR